MKTTLRKILAMLLCLCMCLSLVPAVYAVDDGIVGLDEETREKSSAGAQDDSAGGIVALDDEPAIIELIPDEAETPDSFAGDDAFAVQGTGVPQTEDDHTASNEPETSDEFAPDDDPNDADEEEIPITDGPRDDETFAARNIAVNEENFPDDAFRAYVTGFDKDGDGLSEEEIASVTFISVSQRGIRSLKGIEYFTALNRLYCDGNQLTSLDVSNYADLEYLKCFQNQLTSLRVENCPSLEYINCAENQLSSLNIAGLPSLTTLNCCDNQLTSLIIRNCSWLSELYCNNNDLPALDISGLCSLSDLFCNNNQLEALNTESCPLFILSCSGNRLKKLDLSKNTGLYKLVCGWNNISELVLPESGSLYSLYANNNALTELNLEKVPALGCLWCWGNPLKVLDLTPCSALSTAVESGNIERYDGSVCYYIDTPNPYAPQCVMEWPTADEYLLDMATNCFAFDLSVSNDTTLIIRGRFAVYYTPYDKSNPDAEEVYVKGLMDEENITSVAIVDASGVERALTSADYRREPGGVYFSRNFLNSLSAVEYQIIGYKDSPNNCIQVQMGTMQIKSGDYGPYTVHNSPYRQVSDPGGEVYVTGNNIAFPRYGVATANNYSHVLSASEYTLTDSRLTFDRVFLDTLPTGEYNIVGFPSATDTSEQVLMGKMTIQNGTYPYIIDTDINITWTSEDGAEILKTEQKIPSYTPRWTDAEPVKANDADWIYVFDGWTIDGTTVYNNEAKGSVKAFEPLYADTVFKAHFVKKPHNEEYQRALSLTDSVAVRWRISKIADGADASKYSAVVNYKGYSTRYTSGLTSGIVLANCAAKEMTERATVHVFYDGVEIKSLTYSVNDYCSEMLAKEAASGENKWARLMQATQDYGYTAMVYYNYPGDRPNGGGAALVGAQAVPTLGSTDAATVVKTPNAGIGISAVNFRLITEAQTILSVAFVKASGSTRTAADYVFTVDGVVIPSKKVTDANGVFEVRVTGIPTKNLSKTVTVSATEKNGSRSASFAGSPIGYMSAAAYSAKTGDSLKNMVRAMYNYHLEAKSALPA